MAANGVPGAPYDPRFVQYTMGGDGVMREQRIYRTEWKESWSGCFEDWNSCLMATFCPCIQFGMNYTATSYPYFNEPAGEVISKNKGKVVCACALWLAGAWFCGGIGTGILQCLNRGTLREKYNISTGDCSDSLGDCALSFCCQCCALAQEFKELRWREQQPMGISQPGGVLVGAGRVTEASQRVQANMANSPPPQPHMAMQYVAQGQPGGPPPPQQEMVMLSPPGAPAPAPVYVASPQPGPGASVVYVQGAPPQGQPVMYVQQQQQPYYPSAPQQPPGYPPPAQHM